MDGAPRLSNRFRYLSWSRILSKEFRLLRKRASQRLSTVIDQYGAINPVEFFATSTESFFERPRQLAMKHPELYEELKSYYRVDPATWASAEQNN